MRDIQGNKMGKELKGVWQARKAVAGQDEGRETGKTSENHAQAAYTGISDLKLGVLHIQQQDNGYQTISLCERLSVKKWKQR